MKNASDSKYIFMRFHMRFHAAGACWALSPGLNAHAGSPADAPPRDEVGESRCLVHHDAAQLVKVVRILHGLSKHVSQVVGGTNERHLDLKRLPP